MYLARKRMKFLSEENTKALSFSLKNSCYTVSRTQFLILSCSGSTSAIDYIFTGVHFVAFKLLYRKRCSFPELSFRSSVGRRERQTAVTYVMWTMGSRLGVETKCSPSNLWWTFFVVCRRFVFSFSRLVQINF